MSGLVRNVRTEEFERKITGVYHMNIRRICTSVTALALASFTAVELADAAPRKHITERTSFRIGSNHSSGDVRGGGIVHCDVDSILVSENVDMGSIISGNSVNCFGGSGTPGHSYGRSHDLSIGATAGLPLEVNCVHFGMASLSMPVTATVKIYKDTNGTAGPMPDSSDLWLLGSTTIDLNTTSNVMYSATFSAPVQLEVDSLIFVEIIIPEMFPGTNEIASNNAGEFSATWLKTTNGDCGIGSWVNPAALGFANMHLLEAVEVRVPTIPDPCDEALPACAEDVDGDGTVAVSDILALIGAWGDCGDGMYRPAGDIAPMPNGDCCVNVQDVLAVISAWGNECDTGGGDGVIINELRIDHPGTDDNEYVELGGPAGTSLDGYSYIVIGDGVGGEGVLETIIDLTGLVIADDGLLSLGKAEMTIATPDVVIDGLSFENSNTVTHMIVEGLTAILGDDLDAEDDGILDGNFWLEEIDSVGLQDVDSDGNNVGVLYTNTIVGPNGIYPAAHIFSCENEWYMGVFDGFDMDTPGEPNICDASDLDDDGVFDNVDNCYLYNPDQYDCNDNGIGDVCDIADGTSQDCNSNGIADECEADCDGNGIPDECDIANGAVDCDGNGILDSCEADCNENGVVDACDISSGTSLDDNGNGVPDECEVGNLLYTSFEEPLIGGQYTDLGDPLVDHQLVNNDGEAMVEWVSLGAEMGFTAHYYNTRDGVGLTDGDYVGITNYTGTVGGFPDGIQGYQMSDCDGMMEITFDTATSSGAWNVSLDIFIQTTGYESDDAIIVDVLVDGGAVLSLLDSTGQDINDLGIEGAWFNLLVDLDGYTEATLRVAFDSNSGSEAVYIDNVVFSSNAIEDTDGDGVPDSQDNCYLPNPGQLDCNSNAIGDVCDIADGMSFDCNMNDIPDECEADCNTNGVPDECDINDGTSQDADGNGVPDECEDVSGYMVITGIIDGPLPGGSPKAIELYVISDITDLSLFGVGSANNGGGTDGQEFTFDSVTASAGQFIYITNNSDDFMAFLGFAPDYVHSSANNNGDDAIELFENGNVIDTFGDINVDGSGQPWEYQDGWVSRIGGTGPDGIMFMLESWTYSGINVLDGETSNDTAVTPFPAGEYIH